MLYTIAWHFASCGKFPTACTRARCSDYLRCLPVQHQTSLLESSIEYNISPPLFVRKAGNEFPSNLAWVVLARQSLYVQITRRKRRLRLCCLRWLKRRIAPSPKYPSKSTQIGPTWTPNKETWCKMIDAQFQHGIFVVLVSLKFLLF